MAAAAQLERVASRSVYGVTAFSSGPVDDATRHLAELGLASHFVSKSYGPLSTSTTMAGKVSSIQSNSLVASG